MAGAQRHIIQILSHLSHVSGLLWSLGCSLLSTTATSAKALFINRERLICLVIKSFYVGRSLHSHHMVKSVLLTGKLSLVIVSFSLTCRLL